MRATLLVAVGILAASVALADQYVDGYTRKDGTYVKPHWRNDADSSFGNNWSTKGNVSPGTGEKGTRTTLPPKVPYKSYRDYSTGY